MEDNNFIFCTKCGTKNAMQNEFCTKCGQKLFRESHQEADNTYFTENIRPQFYTKGTKSNVVDSIKTNRWFWGVVILIIIGISGVVGYNYYLKQQREDITSCVYDELNDDYFRVSVDQDEKRVTIIPDSEESKSLMIYIITEAPDSEAADTMDGYIQKISQKIDDDQGDGWTVSLQNPTNSDRSLWIYEDGNAKYRLQDDN